MKSGAFFWHGDWQASCNLEGLSEVRDEEIGGFLGHFDYARPVLVRDKAASVSRPSYCIHSSLVGLVQQIDAGLGDVQIRTGLKEAVYKSEGLGAV